jgi:hypothetical protein
MNLAPCVELRNRSGGAGFTVAKARAFRHFYTLEKGER